MLIGVVADKHFFCLIIPNNPSHTFPYIQNVKRHDICAFGNSHKFIH